MWMVPKIFLNNQICYRCICRPPQLTDVQHTAGNGRLSCDVSASAGCVTDKPGARRQLLPGSGHKQLHGAEQPERTVPPQCPE